MWKTFCADLDISDFFSISQIEHNVIKLLMMCVACTNVFDIKTNITHVRTANHYPKQYKNQRHIYLYMPFSETKLLSQKSHVSMTFPVIELVPDP